MCRDHAIFAVLMYLQMATGRVLDDVIANTLYGQVRGKRVLNFYGIGSDVVTDLVDIYLGVPYAAPPIADLRFKPPQRPSPWDGVRNATEPSWVCPQLHMFHPETGREFQNEDCLTLDIYTPYEEYPSLSPRTYPVLVYIHGGSYEVGSGKLYDGSVLATFGVVVVTINYRLGALGFLTSGGRELSGNFGMLDQIHSLKWVQENIGYFRGDPGRVTIFGHSAGGASVGILLTIPAATGLFHRAIAQSGSATASYSFHHDKVDFRWYMRKVGDIFNCSDSALDNIVSCVKKLPFHHIINSRTKFPLFDPIDPEFRPFVDGSLLPASPRDLLRDGNFTRVPFMIGTVKEEFDNYFNGGVRHKPAFDIALDRYVHNFTGGNSGILDMVRYEYTDWRNIHNSRHLVGNDAFFDRGALLSDMHMVAPTVDIAMLVAQHNPEVYQYHFSTHDSFHSVELNYVFGAPFSGICADEMSSSGCQNFTQRDKRHSIFVMTLWSNFAKYGNPTPGEKEARVKWERFTPTEKKYLHLSAHESKMRDNLRADKVAFWNVLVPRLKNNSLHFHLLQQGSTGQNETKMWTFLGISGTLLFGIMILLFLFIRARMRLIKLELWYLRHRGPNIADV